MSLAPAFLDDLRSRAGLASLIGRRVKLQKAGREWKGCCPFHNEKSPSFYVNEEKGFYHCFGCGAHGDAIGFLMADGGLSFMEAVHALAAETGMQVPVTARDREEEDRRKGLHGAVEAASEWFRQQLGGIGGADGRRYLEGRGVTAANAETFGLGFAPDSRNGLRSALKRDDGELVRAGLLIQPDGNGAPYDRFRGRLMFPIHDTRGRCVGFGGRALGDAQPKYLNSPDSPLFDKGRLLYNYHRAAPAARKSGRLVVVEGYMDVIGLAQVGIAEAVAPLGTAFTDEQLKLAWRLVDAPLVAFDGDKAGQAAAMRLALRALPQLIPGKWLEFVIMPAGEDPFDVARRGGSEAVEAILQQATPLSRFIFQQEAANANLATAEGRVSFQQRLADHAKTIVNPAVQDGYARDWKRAAFELFAEMGRASFSGRSRGREFVRAAAETLKPETRENRRKPVQLVQAMLLASFVGMEEAVDHHIEALYQMEWRTDALASARDALASGDLPDPRLLAGAVPLVKRGLEPEQFSHRMAVSLSALLEFDHIRAELAESRRLHDSAPEESFQAQKRLNEARERVREMLVDEMQTWG